MCGISVAITTKIQQSKVGGGRGVGVIATITLLCWIFVAIASNIPELWNYSTHSLKG